MNYEQKLLQDLRRNEYIIQVLSADDLITEYQAVKGMAKAYTVALLDSLTAARLLMELGYRVDQLEVKAYANGKRYVIFKGYAGTREIFRGTRYLTSNPNIVRMAVGPRGIVSSARGGFVIGFVLSVGLEVFDYLIRDDATLSYLLGTISTDLLKIGVSAIAGAAAGLAVGSAAIVGTIAAAPLIAAIVTGVVVGVLLDDLDARLGVTQALIKGYERTGIRLREIEYEFNRQLNWFERNPHMIPCLFGPCSGIRGY